MENIRRIDDLARVNIPREIRKVLFGDTRLCAAEGKFLKFEIGKDNIVLLKVVEENDNE